MKNILDVFVEVIRKLEGAEVPYMIVGSLASFVYGEPRMTHDMDLVIDVVPGDAAKFEKLFLEDEFYCPPPEVLLSEVVHRGQFNLIHHESGLKIDLMVRKVTAHSQEEFRRRKKVPFWEGVEAFMASPEDVIVKKLDFYRQGGSEKHLKDIRGILSQTQVDRDYLQKWIADLRLEKEWALTE